MKWRPIFADCTLIGDFLNAQADEHEVVLTFKNCTVTGGITTGTVTHHQGEPSEDQWWLIGTVKGAYGPVEGDKGTTASFDATSKWIVDKDCWLSGLTIAEGAEITAPQGKTLTMTVDGKATAIVPGSYTGKIIMTVA